LHSNLFRSRTSSERPFGRKVGTANAAIRFFGRLYEAEQAEENMVNAKVAAQPFDASNVNGPAFERFPAHETSLGSLKILRALPIRQKRLVGAWCFLDRFGPLSFSEAKPMDVAPHPHIGLQTVSWLLQGEIVH
jgi:hypothetical protein